MLPAPGLQYHFRSPAVCPSCFAEQSLAWVSMQLFTAIHDMMILLVALPAQIRILAAPLQKSTSCVLAAQHHAVVESLLIAQST